MSGLELLKRVKGNKGLANVRFIMVTAETDFEHIVAALTTGADGYVHKPFDIYMLRSAMNECLGLNAKMAG